MSIRECRDRREAWLEHWAGWKERICKAYADLEQAELEGTQKIIEVIEQIAKSHEYQEATILGSPEILKELEKVEPLETDLKLPYVISVKLADYLISEARGDIKYRAEIWDSQSRKEARLTIFDQGSWLLRFHVSTFPGVIIESQNFHLNSSLSAMRLGELLMITESFASFILERSQQSVE